ncbi:pep-cterm sorting domain-containing protein [Anaeramoeba ignava]|uniref:Pep-cterm sorting domain-containing protein n=1 Tax=Anaeramoeba ignava TaxID=1746090 RepID=A0A9Q0L8R5_ANAIG|nr:pep-cterm sorting domain-containing protein [Anaeramoeba ignava]
MNRDSSNKTNENQLRITTSFQEKERSINNLIDNFSHLFLENKFKDFSIFVKEKEKGNLIEIKVHKAILNVRSSFFKSFFNQQESSEIRFPDFNKETMEIILRYIYTGEISFSLTQDLIPLLKSSKFFHLDFFSNFLEKRIIDSLNESNVFHYFKENQLIKSKKIQKKCLNFIHSRFSSLQKKGSFLNLDQNQMNIILEFEKKQKEIFDSKFFHMIEDWIQSHYEDRNMDLDQRKEMVTNFIIKLCDNNSNPIQNQNQIQNQNPIQNQMKNQKEIQMKNQKEIQMKNQILKETWKNSTILSENEQIKNLNIFLEDENFFNSMQKGFSTKKDGFSSQIFHFKVDDKGKTLIIIKTKDNYIFGGFSEVGFISGQKKFLSDPKAFIFTLKNPKNDPPQKFNIKQNQQKTAIQTNSLFGPIFGAGFDILLNSNLRNGYTNFGFTYNTPKDIIYGTNEARNYLAGSFQNWEVEEIECYFLD